MGFSSKWLCGSLWLSRHKRQYAATAVQVRAQCGAPMSRVVRCGVPTNGAVRSDILTGVQTGVQRRVRQGPVASGEEAAPAPENSGNLANHGVTGASQKYVRVPWSRTWRYSPRGSWAGEPWCSLLRFSGRETQRKLAAAIRGRVLRLRCRDLDVYITQLQQNIAHWPFKNVVSLLLDYSSWRSTISAHRYNRQHSAAEGPFRKPF